MDEVRVQKASLQNIADAIREKTKETGSYYPADMADAIGRIQVTEMVIESLQITANGEYKAPEGVNGYDPITVDVPPDVKAIDITANGTYTATDCDGYNEINVAVEGIPTDEELTITGICTYRFANDGWNWFIDKYGDRITTKDITNPTNMFYNSTKLKDIPFDINISPSYTSSTPASSCFYHCDKLTRAPYIYNMMIQELQNMFCYCYNLREVPDDYCDTWRSDKVDASTGPYSVGNFSSIFARCVSLRHYPRRIFEVANKYSNQYSANYSSAFQFCHALDEVVNFPMVSGILAAQTSNCFSSFVEKCFRLKRLTFETPNGQPIVLNWKNQYLDLSTIGYIESGYHYTSFTNFNSGITPDKDVWNDATYQALKDDPDWFTSKKEYSRYNLASAVETINSLPDLSTAGGTNTIKFKTGAGTATDGGGITAETIVEASALAATKGWTVSLV